MKPIDVTKIVIGQYADYLDTGMWRLNKDTGRMMPPDGITPSQLRDAHMMFGEFMRTDENHD